MANTKNLAASFVATAPSPATTGLSLVVTAATGTYFPTAPFYATLTPPASLSTPGTSEIVLVTAVSTDTLTIVRAQKSTTAKTVVAGWIITNGVYTEDVYTSSIVIGEVLGGTPNGALTTFTTSQLYSSVEVFKNGVRMQSGAGNDYTISGNTITFASAPATGAKLLVNGIVGSQVMIQGSNSLITDEVPAGAVGGNTVYTTNRPYIGASLEVYINGDKQKRGVHFFENSPATGGFTMSDAPLTGDDIMVNYQFAASVSGNADTVDNLHASSTPTANTLFPLDALARLPLVGTGRQNNTSNTVTNPRIETGWVAIPVSSTTPNATIVITFGSAFTSVPIVLATFGGDTAGASSTLGAGGANVQAAAAMARTVSTTGATLTAGTFNSSFNWTSGNTVYIHWIAIGV